MVSKDSHLGPIQVVVLVLVGVIAVAGGVVCIVAPHTLSFGDYAMKVIPALTGALALLGVGKGLHLGLAGQVEQRLLADAPQVVSEVEKGNVAAAFESVQRELEAEPSQPSPVTVAQPVEPTTVVQPTQPVQVQQPPPAA